MKVSLRWLSRYVDLDDKTPQQVLLDLTMSTAEVEGVEEFAGGIEDVVVGHVLAREKHPDADKLSVTRVDVGAGAPLQIVCGAQNVAAGQTVAVVLPGGTGETAALTSYEVAGKTGTVQVVSHQAWQDTSTLPWEQRNHAWFASYAPAGAPELVVVVFVEHGGQGSRAAAPIAGALHAFYFRTDLGTSAAS